MKRHHRRLGFSPTCRPEGQPTPCRLTRPHPAVWPDLRERRGQAGGGKIVERTVERPGGVGCGSNHGHNRMTGWGIESGGIREHQCRAVLGRDTVSKREGDAHDRKAFKAQGRLPRWRYRPIPRLCLRRPEGAGCPAVERGAQPPCRKYFTADIWGVQVGSCLSPCWKGWRT